jgi:signal transduction histidine kinase
VIVNGAFTLFPQHDGMETSLPALMLGATLLLGAALPSVPALLARSRAQAQAAEAARELEARSRGLPDTGLEGRARALLGLSADVSDLLAQATGPRVLREGDTELASLLDEVIGQIAQSLTPGRRAWRVAPELRGLTLEADRRALSGALRQVLTRVVRQTRDGDAIRLRLVQADESVAIVVEDEGDGHAGEDLDGLTLGGTRGLGLGLVVARDLLRAHGGDLTVEAVPGIGARAWLTLPRSRVVEPAR